MMLVPATFLVSCMGWDNLLTSQKKHKPILLFKTIDDLTPFYLHVLFESRSTGYKLRNSERTLFVPKPRTNYGKRRQFYGMSYRKMYKQHAP
jgi:hypothetical protein